MLTFRNFNQSHEAAYDAYMTGICVCVCVCVCVCAYCVGLRMSGMCLCMFVVYVCVWCVYVCVCVCECVCVPLFDCVYVYKNICYVATTFAIFSLVSLHLLYFLWCRSCC